MNNRDKDVTITDVQTSIAQHALRTPIKFGGRVTTALPILNVSMRVSGTGGRQASGIGSMPIGNSWSWPSNVLNHERTLSIMELLSKRMNDSLPGAANAGHPVEIMTGLEPVFHRLAAKTAEEESLPEPIPALAVLVTASPFDAALHDAYGRLHGRNSYDCLGPDFMNHDLSTWLTDEFKGEYLDRYTRRKPAGRMPLYHLVGGLDVLSDADIQNPVGDGLPESLAQWIKKDGLTHLKIKMAGDDIDWDCERVLAVDRVAEENCPQGPDALNYSLDFNEKCQTVEYLLDFLSRVKEKKAEAFNRIQYIEQPTSRHLEKHRDLHMHKVASIKPVVIDEALVDFEHFQLAVQQGYSGVALKTCKGQTHALLMAAAAIRKSMFLCVQDLTCTGISFLHSAGLCARIPGVAAVEGNGRQYCPQANMPFEKRWNRIFNVVNGTIDTSDLVLDGLGHNDGGTAP